MVNDDIIDVNEIKIENEGECKNLFFYLLAELCIIQFLSSLYPFFLHEFYFKDSLPCGNLHRSVFFFFSEAPESPMSPDIEVEPSRTQVNVEREEQCIPPYTRVTTSMERLDPMQVRITPPLPLTSVDPPSTRVSVGANERSADFAPPSVDPPSTRVSVGGNERSADCAPPYS